jgi:endonuclease/exonuclease/phosphatase (EEP) superfamily protein YafD
MTASHSSHSPRERRFTRTVSLTFVTCSILYLLAFLADYESNIIIFLANVFAPVILLLTVGASFAAEFAARIRGRRPLLRERIVRASLIISTLVPTIVGDVRSHVTHQTGALPSPQTILTVLDANLLGPIDVSTGFYAEVERLRPDIITLQELNPGVAAQLSERLGSEYVCQALEAKPGVFGMGVFSKFPCVKRDSSRFMEGIGRPQIVDVRLPNNKTVGVINVHTIPPHWLVRNSPDDNEVQQLSNAVVEREVFVKKIIEDSRMVSTDAVILAGDLNATVRNRVYRIIRQMGLFDSFAIGSRLRGGTWPGPDFPLPSWILRIDFIFHCAGLISLHAETLPEGYGSDHRGVFARLALTR